MYKLIKMSAMVKKLLLSAGLSFCFLLVLGQASCLPGERPGSPNSLWKVGVARAVITPSDPMRLDGYAHRTAKSTGVLHDLNVKVLCLEDAKGYKAVYVALDLIGLARETSEKMCRQIMTQHGLSRNQILINCSHTHSAPVFNRNHFLMHADFSDEDFQAFEAYEQFVAKQATSCVAAAIQDLSPCRLLSGKGLARFATNRRSNQEQDFSISSDVYGPSDYTVPVLAAYTSQQQLKAVLFGYACHASTLDDLQISGDFPGFAQVALEQHFEGCMALYFSGCGADQNPLPRKAIPWAEQYGEELAVAVKRSLKGPLMVLEPSLQVNYNELLLKYDEPLSERKLKELAESDSWKRGWAQHWLEKQESGATIPESYDFYPVQTWKLGDQMLVALGGEVVVDYAIHLRKTYDNLSFIMACSNDVMGYIPTEEILDKRGYEGASSVSAYGQPAMWAPGLEELILDEVKRQLKSFVLERK
jgi:hypothetical protein